MTSHRAPSRKVVLFRGTEVVSRFAHYATTSPRASLRSIRNEFYRNPVLTHATLVDAKGRKWSIHRRTHTLKLLWLGLRIR